MQLSGRFKNVPDFIKESFTRYFTRILIIVPIIAILSIQMLFSQNQNVGIGTASPDPSAILELGTTNKGFLVPRLTDVQKTAIASPATGLMIFSTTSNRFEYNAGTPGAPVWLPLLSSLPSGTDMQTLRYNGTTLVANSALVNDGTNIGIGIAVPTTKLDVNGIIRTGSDGTDGELRIFSEQGATDYTVTLKPNAAMTQSTTYVLPPDDGTANQVLVTDGSGGLTWGNPYSSISNVIQTSATIDPPNLGGSLTDDVDVAVTGAQTGSTVIVSPSNDLDTDRYGIAYAYVPSANVVRIRFVSWASRNPNSMTFYITVIR